MNRAMRTYGQVKRTDAQIAAALDRTEDFVRQLRAEQHVSPRGMTAVSEELRRIDESTAQEDPERWDGLS